MLNRFKIGTKLAIIFGIIILLLLIKTGIIISSYRSITHSTQEVLAMFESSIRASDTTNHANQMRRHFLVYLAQPSDELANLFAEEWNETASILEDVETSSSIEANRQEAARLMNILRDIRHRQDAFMALSTTIDELRSTCTGIANGVRDDLQRLGTDLFEKHRREAENSGRQGVDVASVELEAEVYRARILVVNVLQLRDNFVFSTVPAQQAAYRTDLFATMGQLASKLEDIRRHPAFPPEFAAQMNAIMESQVRWANTAGPYVNNISTQRDMQEPILQALRDVMEGVNNLQDNVSGAARETGQAQEELAVRSEVVSIGVAATVILGSVLMGWILTVSVAGGLRGAVNVMKVIADEGNVAIEIPRESLQRGDEVGDIAQAVQAILTQFQNVERLANDLADGNYNIQTKVRGDQDTMNIYLNKMLDQVNQAMGEINDSVRQVTTGSGEVSSAAQSLSSGAQESAASLQQISASMSQVSSQVKMNAENAAQARDLAQHTNKAASEGQEAMKDMTVAMSQITENSNEIQRVIKVIDDIAFQTNLLALNAAVEAARAGQHGKGFAVVAEEVRNLASRSAKAARETSELIDKSSQEIEKGGEVAARTAEVLNSIVTEIKQTSDIIAGIAVASNEQAEGVNQISIGLQQIDAVTQQNTAAAEQSASAANEMSGMATNLQRLIAKFRLRGHSRV